MSESDKSGKPELSNDELTRISKEAYSRYTGYDGTAMSIGFRQGAEWATLHERSAAQARIAELEAALEKIADYVDPHSPYNSGYIMKGIAKSVLKR